MEAESFNLKGGGKFHASCSEIMLPIKVNDYFRKNKKIYVQLDLGTGGTLLLYDNSFFPLLKRNLAIDTSHILKWSITVAKVKRKIGGQIAGEPFALDSFYIVKNMGGLSLLGYSVLGTVGLDFFRNKVLVLDYIHNRFLITNKFDSLPVEWRNKTLYESLKFYHGHCSVPIQIGDTTLSNGFLDTGSGLFDLLVSSQKLWERLTGRKVNAPDNEYINAGYAWGKEIKNIGANMKNDTLKISNYSISSPTIWYWENDSSDDIIFGNNPFAGKGIVIYDLINNKFAAF